MAAPRRTVVLLVDPHEDTRDMYAEFLRVKGFEVLRAERAAGALPLARRADVVVTDLRLRGEMDGAALIARLRQNAGTADVPVVVLTGSIVHGDRLRAEAAGANAYILKPCSPADLQKAIGVRLLSRESRWKKKTAASREREAAWRMERAVGG